MAAKTRIDRILAAVQADLKAEIDVALRRDASAENHSESAYWGLRLANQIVGTYAGQYGKARDIE